MLPDYNTSVNVADIKLTKSKRPGSWEGLDDLKQVRCNDDAEGPMGARGRRGGARVGDW